MLDVVVRPFMADRQMEHGEVIDTSEWRNRIKLLEQHKITATTAGFEAQACACGRLWSDLKHAKHHFSIDGCWGESGGDSETRRRPGRPKRQEQ